MSWKIRYKSQFKTDLKKIKHNKKARNLLTKLVQEHFLKDGSIPQAFFPHPLVGKDERFQRTANVSERALPSESIPLKPAFA